MCTGYASVRAGTSWSDATIKIDEVASVAL